jgi:integrase
MTGSVQGYELTRKGKKGKKSWGYRFRAGKNALGKWTWITKKGFERQSDAEEALQKAIAEHKSNPTGQDPRTFSEVFDHWISQHCERNCEPTTTEGYMAKGAYAKRYLGHEPLSKLKVPQIEKSLNALRDHGGKRTAEHPDGRPLASKTVREVAAVINATFNFGIRWGVVSSNPMKQVRLPRLEKREPKVMERHQLEDFIASVAGHQWLHPLLLLDAATGCRRGELLALTWDDVNWDARALSVTKSLAQTPLKGVFLKLPKGRKGRRFTLPHPLLTHSRRTRQFRTKTGVSLPRTTARS